MYFVFHTSIRFTWNDERTFQYNFDDFHAFIWNDGNGNTTRWIGDCNTNNAMHFVNQLNAVSNGNDRAPRHESHEEMAECRIGFDFDKRNNYLHSVCSALTTHSAFSILECIFCASQLLRLPFKWVIFFCSTMACIWIKLNSRAFRSQQPNPMQ